MAFLFQFEDLYLATHLMGADLNNIVKTQRLSDDHVQFLIYQILRGISQAMLKTHVTIGSDEGIAYTENGFLFAFRFKVHSFR